MKAKATAVLVAVFVVAATLAIVLGLTLTGGDKQDKNENGARDSGGLATGTQLPTSLPSSNPSAMPMSRSSFRPTPTSVPTYSSSMPSASASPSKLTDSPTSALVCKDATETDAEGPFYTPDAPVVQPNESLPTASDPGERISILVRLLRSSSGSAENHRCGSPLANWTVDIWHTDSSGVYDNTGYKFRGKFKTDVNGELLLRTILPGRYQPRPRHVHFKLWREDESIALTSQFYMGDDAAELASLQSSYDGRVVEINSSGEGSLDVSVD